MKLPKWNTYGFFLFLICPSLLSGRSSGHQVAFYVHNKCPFAIWPATAPNTGHPVIADGGFHLTSGETQRIYAPWDWNGRMWARTGCNFTSRGQPACETGDCDGRLACNGLIGTPPVTLVQVSLQADGSKPNFYDVSLVDGYNLPVSVTSKQVSSKCTIGGCSKNLKNSCPVELQVLNKNGEIVACKKRLLGFQS
ncbi:thaumatin-like protein isoform X2 [Populus alba x Populus x berolinensis]|uniref:Thaumatin-like protein isoform X2 n=1 Tax=Populus alba x Populus x berolinensis TaxID=444605 RepID=A0AAD6PSN3_9ROSI|nr:thaumatin-like protein isoform X2 [Populus alba x Populus x berolinensis]